MSFFKYLKQSSYSVPYQLPVESRWARDLKAWPVGSLAFKPWVHNKRKDKVTAIHSPSAYTLTTLSYSLHLDCLDPSPIQVCFSSILCVSNFSPHEKSWLIGKASDAGRDWGQEEKGTTENKMAGWHHWLDGRGLVNSGSWWWTGRPGVLRFMGSQRVGHDWATDLIWSDVCLS